MLSTCQNSLTDASTSTIQLAALLPFQRHIDVAAMFSNVADLANTEILQGSADDAEDTASDLAEFDMEDPVTVELNDSVDILDASILDDDFESVHG